MRIIKIEMENLNSLKGYWSIDFTHPDYSNNHNLFVICGETGSGKTTILDAITLALYGKTPRQENFGKSNEIMTRRTASCMARVTYECKKGKFISEFNQKRARNNINGSLQAAHGLITNVNTGVVSEQLSIQRLEKQTSEIIQLDYNQFLRSIMLAQGDFDSFINSNSRERADILAKINGTEKYKAVAQRLWEKANNNIKECERLESEASKITILSDDEIETISKDIKEKISLIEENKEAMEKIDSGIKWLNDLSKAEKNKADAINKRKEYELELERFEKDEITLKRAEKANNCKVDYAKFLEISEAQKQDESKLKAERAVLAEYKEKSEKFKTEAEESKHAFEAKQKSFEENERLWEKVQALDSQITALNKIAMDSEKRLRESCNDWNNNKDKIQKYVRENEEITLENKAIEEYLSKNEFFEKFPEDIIMLKQKQNNLEACKEKLISLKSELNDKELKLEKLHETEKQQSSILDEVKANLKEFIATEYLSISLLLRQTLHNGKPCPVCGAIEHPFCNEDQGINNSTDTTSVALNISNLNNQKDKIEGELENTRKEISNIENKLEILKAAIGTEEKEQNSILDSINDILGKYNKKMDASANFLDFGKSIIGELTAENKKYDENKARHKNNIIQANTNKEIISSIDLNLLEAKYNSDNSIWQENNEQLNILKDQRMSLFGVKKVENERNLLKTEIESFKKRFENAEKLKYETEKQANNSKTRTETYETSIRERKTLLEDSEKKFAETLRNNGFDSISEYKSSLLSDDDFNNLANKKEYLKTYDTRTQTELKTANSQYEKCLKENITDKDIEFLQNEKNHLLNLDEEYRNKKSELVNQLEMNKANAEKHREAYDAYLKQKELKPVYENIKSIIGIQNGTDFQEFVQALAFNRLLSIANPYVFSISGKYTLVQVENEVDFKIHDVNYPDSKDDRPISNMSGGEKFIISLSLALGIADLASQNVKVDSLFLDEGFGTLSGEPLYEAITALKSLQDSNKMLGIITHVEAVINEFDQKITASREAGGTSRLTGSGVSQR